MSSPCLADSDCIALTIDIDGALVVEPILSADPDQGIECRGDGLWAPKVPPTVTSLPAAGDYDGQRVAYQPTIATMENDVEWDMRWDDAYGQWFYMGGAAAVARVLTAESISAGSGTWETLATDGPLLNMPYAGTYQVHFGAVINGAEAATETMVGLQLGGVDPTDGRSLFDGGQAQRHTAAGFVPVVLAGAATGIRMRYQRNGTATSATFLNRWLAVVPVHVTP